MLHENPILPEIDSTQLELKRRLQLNPALPAFSFVQAFTQTGGRGRQERGWLSPEGNFYFSVLLRGPHLQVTWLPLFIATALKRAIDQTFSLQKPIKLKWPNDLIIEPFAKLSGILCEKVGDHVIAGIGVNVMIAPAVDGREVVSLQNITHEKLGLDDLSRLREALLKELSQPFDLAAIQKNFEAHSLTPAGSHIEWVDVGTGKTGTGEVIGLGQYGDLRVKIGSMEPSLFSEEVTAVKPAP